MKIVYVAHPLGSDPLGRAENVKKAARWVVWVAERGCAPVASWVILASVWDETHRDEGMRIDLKLVEVCDELWLCGDHISPGMKQEADHARKHGVHVHDFTGLELDPA